MKVFLASLLLATVATAATSTLTVHVDQPTTRVSPTLYGIFFEEINRAGDGGLYAEMIQNRSFEDAYAQVKWSMGADNNLKADPLPDFNAAIGWTLIKGEGTEAKME